MIPGDQIPAGEVALPPPPIPPLLLEAPRSTEELSRGGHSSGQVTDRERESSGPREATPIPFARFYSTAATP